MLGRVRLVDRNELVGELLGLDDFGCTRLFRVFGLAPILGLSPMTFLCGTGSFFLIRLLRTGLRLAPATAAADPASMMDWGISLGP